MESTTGRHSGRQGPERIAQKETEALRSRRSLNRTGGITAAVGTVTAAVILAVTVGTGPNTSIGLPVVPEPIVPESVPMEQGPALASRSSSASGGTVDGVERNSSEQVANHVHTLLSDYVNGVLRPLPAGIGVVPPGGGVDAGRSVRPRIALPLVAPGPCPGWNHPHRVAAGHSYVPGQFFDPRANHSVSTTNMRQPGR